MNELSHESENYAELLTVKYAADIQKLARYIRYFENKKGSDVASSYDGKQGESSLKFPVYDSSLLSFVKEAEKTELMDPNYMYKYRKYRINTEAAEKAAIDNAKPKDIDLLRAVLSRYVLEGRYKSVRWIEAAERGVFYDVLAKFVELSEAVQ
ncbi:MAG: DUF6508 domain-containing protein [Lachnospiraceae bacterium]|nr:DUF6508 domain-containing protein [Lachnospiraceae bacterium]